MTEMADAASARLGGIDPVPADGALFPCCSSDSRRWSSASSMRVLPAASRSPERLAHRGVGGDLRGSAAGRVGIATVETEVARLSAACSNGPSTSRHSTSSGPTPSGRWGCCSSEAFSSAGFVAGLVLRPVRRISGDVAKEIEATDLSRRIELDGPEDELKRTGRHVRRDARPHRRCVRVATRVHPRGEPRAAQSPSR